MISAGVCGFGRSAEACATCFASAWTRAWLWPPTRSVRRPRPAGWSRRPALRAASEPDRRISRAATAGRSGFLVLDRNAGALVILVVRLAAPEQRREQARHLADGCGIVAIAAALDVGAGQLIALQRTAIGRQVDGTSIREHPGELIVGHARPVTDAAGIEMDERRSRGRVKADAAALQPEPRGADLLQRHVRNVEIHRVAEHVLAEARHAGRAAAEHGVGGGGAVGGDDLDRFLAVDVAVDFPEDVEQMPIHRGLCPGCASRGGSD